MKKLILSFFLVFGLLVFAGGAFAQHSAYTYDDSSSVTKTGVVTEVLWANPRCFVNLDVKGEDGSVVNWSIELTNPRTLIRFGVAPVMIPEGKEITITFSPAKDAPNRGVVKQMRIDGKVVFDMNVAISDGGLILSSPSRDTAGVVLAAARPSGR